jgi:hypothetical protein
MQLGKRRFLQIVGVGGCRCEEGRGCSRVDGFSEGVELFQGDIPPAGEDVRGEFTPVRRVVEVVVGG